MNTLGAAALHRMNALGHLDDAARLALKIEFERPFTYHPQSEIQQEGQAITGPRLMLSGWAARVRIMEEGDRQIINFVLPGDLIGFCDQEKPLASSSIIAITEVRLCTAPAPCHSERLSEAYAMSRALEEAYLFSQIARLGRFDARERIADLLLELHDRLELAGLAAAGSLTVPLTQEMLADATGLTPVHVNRMLKQAREVGTLSWKNTEVTLLDVPETRRSLGNRATRVSAAALRSDRAHELAPLRH